MSPVLFIQILNLFMAAAVSIPSVHDQRQSGASNIRIDLKDALFVAIADEFGDYDYSYDYSDLTIKPEATSTTAKPAATHSTEESSPVPSAAQNATLVLHPDNNTLEFVGLRPGNETLAAGNPTGVDSHSEHRVPVASAQEAPEKTKLLPVKILEKKYVSSSAVRGKNANSGQQEEGPMLRHCAQGFFLDTQNRCRRIRRPFREGPQA